MPTIISHAAVPLAIGAGLSEKRIPFPLLAVGVAASMLPDADVLLFRFGATYDSIWAHRGFTHSVGFAAAAGLIAALAFRSVAPMRTSFAYVALAALSHGLLDMLTNGGHGVAILWPATEQRFFFDWRPIQVSPLAPGRFVLRAARIARTEFLWIWVPAIVVAFGLRAFGRYQGATSHADSQAR
jgi:inner membrane protein